MSKRYIKFGMGFLLLLAMPLHSIAQSKATFENLQLDPSSYWNGVSATYGDYTNILVDSVFLFSNQFSRNDYGFGLYDAWSGFSYSRMQDDTTAGIGNQYSAVTASGAFGSENYGIFYLMQGKDTIRLKRTEKLDSVFITNASYPYLSMRDGDMFSKKFGGPTGDDPDWFLLSFIGLRGGEVTDTVNFYLADFRDEDPAKDYLVADWQKLDLAALDSVDMIEISLSSSDVGDWGMNTPAYFCVDNFCGADFESFTYTSGDYWDGSSALIGNYHAEFSNGPVLFPNYYAINDYGTGLLESWTGFAYSNMQDISTAGYTNQYSAITGSGAGGSYTYGLCYNLYERDTLYLDQAGPLSGLFVTNGTQGVQSMLHGDGFAKKFGGADGNDPDWFLLTVRGLYNDTCTDTVRFYLADFRFEDNEEDYIVTGWEWVDLTDMDTIDRLEFSLTSSDSGPYGMNTPAFFFFDDINDQLPLVANTIRDTFAYAIDSELVLDLSTTFTDPDDEDESIQMRVKSNSNKVIVDTAYFVGDLLTLELNYYKGESEIAIEARSGGHTITEVFTLTVLSYGDLEMSNAAQIKVFPNPTQGLLRVNIGNRESCKLEVFDLLGHKLSSESMEKASWEVDISEFTPGLYILKIQSDKEVFTYTIQKD